MTITHADLFAGIGGFRLGLERLGVKCVYSAEIDEHCRKTYVMNFDGNHVGDRDITKCQNMERIPDFDILTAGFPCQPFSIAGQRGSFNDTRGTLFYDICRFLEAKKPKAFFLENVPHIKTIDNGKVWETIISSLEELGYTVHHAVIDAKSVVPQRRKRVYIVGFREKNDFKFPEMPDNNITVKDILIPNPPEKYTLSQQSWNSLQRHKERHKKLGHGFGYNLLDVDGHARTVMADSGGLRSDNLVAGTLTSRYYKDGKENLLTTDSIPRRLTPRECARLMGFPDSFKLPVSDMQTYKQLGNSVVPGVIEAIGKEIVKCIQN